MHTWYSSHPQAVLLLAFPVCIVTGAAVTTHMGGLWVNARGS